MEFDEKDNDVIQLLTQLKTAEGGYPTELMALRRQNYIKQIAALGIGAGAASVLDAAAKGGGGSAVPPIASTLLETVLIVAIVIEAGAVALINREKVTDLFRTITVEPQVQEISSPAEILSPVVEMVVPTNTVLVTETATATTIAISTPSPALFFSTTVAGDDEDDVQAAATPNGNNGNHYGQTPQPERTKEPGNGNRGPGNGRGNNP